MPERGAPKFKGWKNYALVKRELEAPPSLDEHLPWWREAVGRDCLVLPNSARGVTIFPPEFLVAWRERVERVRQLKIGPDEMGTPLAAAARAALAFWCVKATPRIKLPVAIFRSGLLLPSGRVEVLVVGEGLEITPPDSFFRAVGEAMRPETMGVLETAIEDGEDESD